MHIDVTIVYSQSVGGGPAMDFCVCLCVMCAYICGVLFTAGELIKVIQDC